MRPTITARLGELAVLVEAQGDPEYTSEIELLAHWLAAHRFYGRLFLATAVTAKSDLSLTSLSQMQKDGVGLLLVEEDDSVKVASDARNPRLVLSLPTGLSYGDAKKAVHEILDDYNAGNRLGACRNIAELVEAQIDKLAIKAARKRWLARKEETVKNMGLSDQINVLAAKDAQRSGKEPLVEDELKHDLHSFRGARNTFDHKVRSRREDQRREQQFPERMLSGARLVSELARLRRKCV